MTRSLSRRRTSDASIIASMTESDSVNNCTNQAIRTREQRVCGDDHAPQATEKFQFAMILDDQLLDKWSVELGGLLASAHENLSDHFALIRVRLTAERKRALLRNHSIAHD